MPGFSNGTVYADNLDFTGAANPSPQMTANGQLVIGNAVTGRPTIATPSNGTNISWTLGAGSIQANISGVISPTNGGRITWSTVGAGGALVVNTGIICTGGAGLSFSLPATSSVGDIIEIALDGSTSWTITQAANQQIRIGSSTTLLGIAGSLSSTAQGDSLRMVCKTANLLWTVLSVMGNITVV